jgi:3-deoxy-7-phosphoheptulonate synthase
MVDCSHANSDKDPARQAPVCRRVLAEVRAGEPAVLGLMLESNLEEGRQDWAPGATLRRGVSITDACIGWDETRALLDEIAEAAGRATDGAARGKAASVA